MGVKTYSAPQHDEFEISVFGPGYGEALVIHVGNGDWITVDSCIDPSTNRPVALAYFEAIGVDPISVKSVVCSHWDDDHIRGLAALFEATEEAKFSCSAAQSSAEFQEVLATWLPSRFIPGGSGVDEFGKILKLLQERQSHVRHPVAQRAKDNVVIWERDGDLPVHIRALSPSESAEAASIARLSKLADQTNEIRRRIPKIEDNDASVVLSVRVAGTNALLGGDLLQNRQSRSFGWYAVVDSHSGGPRHDFFKLPHHATANADDNEIWDHLLDDQVFAATTPVVAGRTKAPNREDCERVLGRTNHAFLSALPLPKKFRTQNKTVQRTILEVAKNAALVPGRFGHIRLRKIVSGSETQNWTETLFGDAISMFNALKQF